ASQYHECMHSQPTTRSGRNGSTAARNGSGLAGGVRASWTGPAAAGTQRDNVPAGRAPPPDASARPVRERKSKRKLQGVRETGTFNSIPALHLTAAASGDSKVQAPRAAAAGERGRSAACRTHGGRHEPGEGRYPPCPSG